MLFLYDHFRHFHICFILTNQVFYFIFQFFFHFPLNQFAAAAADAKLLQSCPTLCDPIDGRPPGSRHHWDSPGKNTGVGCHFLVQCMKMKRESEVAQSCPTLSDPMDPMDCPWDFPGKSTGVGCHCLLIYDYG